LTTGRFHLNVSIPVEAQLAPDGSAYRRDAWNQEVRRASSGIRKQRYIALQPIFDREWQVFGYEALCRDTNRNRFTGDSRTATEGIIKDWLLDGLDRFTDEKPVFLNCTREDLLEFPAILPVSTVPEVLETVQVDDEVEDACRRIKNFGHRIALDDFQLHENNHKLIEIADYIKIDFRLDGKEQRRELLASLRGLRALLIAEKIETREELEAALEEGFDLFQGYYLARPILLSRGGMHSFWLNHLRMRRPFRLR
jgi:c-di-GMP-related signal transduction protein